MWEREMPKTQMDVLMKAPRIAPLPKWKVELVEETIKFLEGEVGGLVTAETVHKRIPAFSIEDIEDAMEQLRKRAQLKLNVALV
jgi:hypothetical protein